MTYEYDDKAAKEAAKYAVAPEHADLQVQCQCKAAEFGCESVRAHLVNFSPAAWDDVSALPASALKSQLIYRGDVLDIGTRVREETAPPKDLLVASFIWGTGPTADGPHRLRQILNAAGNGLEPALQHVIDMTFADPESPDPVAGYAQLYGGYENRAAPGAQPWDRLRGYGPAFFTKFLYFVAPGALILDNRLAKAVHGLSDMPNLVTADGRSLAWTPYRYAVYVHWMRQTAQAIGVRSDLLEVMLFEPPGELADQDGAAE